MMKGVQITNIIKCTLELSSGSYTQWRNLMELAIEESGALDHINWDAPADPDPDWRTVDLILKRWIYATISPELTGMIMDSSRTTQRLYSALAAIFLNNKQQRAIHLISDLHDLRQNCLTIAQYCARVKTVADALRAVDHPWLTSRRASATVLILAQYCAMVREFWHMSWRLLMR
ncbi:uncharacterized protein [Lolium perenne]|uniref:uncharacterized protein n=1 Tax=Lolium perenne TaxID=4522 RepID=UPI0021F58BE3|nr:uncharacterized protein LOC127309899 [Lolium perenne]